MKKKRNEKNTYPTHQGITLTIIRNLIVIYFYFLKCFFFFFLKIILNVSFSVSLLIVKNIMRCQISSKEKKMVVDNEKISIIQKKGHRHSPQRGFEFHPLVKARRIFATSTKDISKFIGFKHPHLSYNILTS